MRYQDKTFTVPGPKATDNRRDCAKLGHWRITLHGKPVCYFCKRVLDEPSDGTDREPTTHTRGND